MAFYLSTWLCAEGDVGRLYNGHQIGIDRRKLMKYIDYFKLAKKKRKFANLM